MFDEILTKIETAIAVLVGIIKAGHPLCGTASGKDSTCAVILMLEAVRRVSAERARQPAHYVSTANTTIENVSLAQHIETMLEEIDSFAADHMLDVTTHVAAPSLAMQFVVSTIGRRTLVRTPGARHSESGGGATGCPCVADRPTAADRRFRRLAIRKTALQLRPDTGHRSYFHPRGANEKSRIIQRHLSRYIPTARRRTPKNQSFVATGLLGANRSSRL